MVSFTLESGSLLVMRGRTQRHWEHCVTKAGAGTMEPRINITFRQARQSMASGDAWQVANYGK